MLCSRKVGYILLSTFNRESLYVKSSFKFWQSFSNNYSKGNLHHSKGNLYHSKGNLYLLLDLDYSPEI